MPLSAIMNQQAGIAQFLLHRPVPTQAEFQIKGL
jgi:hypothetical protein